MRLDALPHPGMELEGSRGERWLVIRRSWTGDPTSADHTTLTLHLVRAGSPEDPRAPRPTPTRTEET